MRAQIFMTLLKNAKNGQNAHHSLESTWVLWHLLTISIGLSNSLLVHLDIEMSSTNLWSVIQAIASSVL